MSTVNGRITPEFDDYTCVSTRGVSVVDYWLTPHDCIKYFTQCRVLRVRQICDELNLQCNKLPDHSLLLCTLRMRHDINVITNATQKPHQLTGITHTYDQPRYKFSNVDNMFRGENANVEINTILSHVLTRDKYPKRSGYML